MKYLIIYKDKSSKQTEDYISELNNNSSKVETIIRCYNEQFEWLTPAGYWTLIS